MENSSSIGAIMSIEELKNIILNKFGEVERLNDISIDENYYSRGVSSLTIVQLQAVVEKAIGVNLDTARLMGFSSIQEWVANYYKILNSKEA